MNMTTNPQLGPRQEAFSTLEALFGVAMTLVIGLSLYSSVTTGLAAGRLSRENQRGTQVIMEKLEYLRLLTWEQVAESDYDPDEEDTEIAEPEHTTGTIEEESPFLIPTNFTALYVPTNQLQQLDSGDNGCNGNGNAYGHNKLYRGQMRIQDSQFSEAYSNWVRRIEVEVSWESAGTVITQRLSTLFSKYGMQNNIPSARQQTLAENY